MTDGNNPLPSLPQINLTFPSSTLASQAFTYTKTHCHESVLNHTARSAYWALVLATKLPQFANTTKPLNLHLVVVACILHDMGWATTASLLSPDKRFEVDGANIARDFISTHNPPENSGEHTWTEADIQRTWDAIAMHTSGSIAKYAAPEVALVHLGITADFVGFGFRVEGVEGEVISEEEYRAVMGVFPRAGFTAEGFKGIICGLCRMKPETTYDNWVGGFGRKFGVDGEGEGREEFGRVWEERQAVGRLLGGLDRLEGYEKVAGM